MTAATPLTVTDSGGDALLLAEASMRERPGRRQARRLLAPLSGARSQLRVRADERRDERRRRRRRAKPRPRRLDPSPVAVPGPAQTQGVHRVRRLARHHAHHRADPAHRARRRRRRDRGAGPPAVAVARAPGRTGRSELRLPTSRAFRRWAVRVRRAARPAHRDLRAAAAPRLRPSRPAPDRSDRLPRQLRPRAGPGAVELPPAGDRQRRPALPLLDRHARALATPHRDRAGHRSGVAVRVAQVAPDDVPCAMGLVATRRRSRRCGRRSGQRCARGQGVRAGRPRAGRSHPRRARPLPVRVRTVRLQARYASALQAIPALGQVGVLALGGWLAIQGEISIGTFPRLSIPPGATPLPVRMFAGWLRWRSRRVLAPNASSSSSTPTRSSPSSPMRHHLTSAEIVFDQVLKSCTVSLC